MALKQRMRYVSWGGRNSALRLKNRNPEFSTCHKNIGFVGPYNYVSQFSLALTYVFRCACVVCGSDGKESACNAGDLGSIPGLRRSHEGGHGNPLQYTCLENPHGQKTLVGYSPWDRKESDMTKQLNTPHSSVVCNNREYIWCLSWVPGPEVQKPLEFPE